jgi:hypothetical protein
MPRVCTVCTHPDRPAIDQALVNHRPFRDIAGHFRVSKSAAVRHYDDHLPATLAEAQRADETATAIDVLGQLRAINAATLAVLADARKAGDGDLALKVVDRVQRQIELQAKLLGELDERPTVNVLVAPEWLVVRATLLDVLRDYPDARQAVAARLVALDGPGGPRGAS